MAQNERIYLGTGLTHPLNVVNGAAETVDSLELINTSIKSILGTEKGTVFFLPEYGSRIHELTFEPNDFILKDLLDVFIKDALKEWEKRVQVVNVDFTIKDDMVQCEVFYRVLASNEIESTIYPFYRKIKY